MTAPRGTFRMKPKIKVCGINNAGFATAAAKAGVDYLGLIFAAGSPRCVTPEEAARIIAAAGRAGPRFVGVFTEHDVEDVIAIASRLGLYAVQLHSARYGARDCARLRSRGFQVWMLDDTSGDRVLIDGRDGAKTGGTGKKGDWTKAAALVAQGYKVVLAGGISCENIRDAIALRPDTIDVNSSIETSPGVKSIDLLRRLLDAIDNK